MRLIDADRLLTDRMKSKYYHLPNGDTAIPIIDIEQAPTIEPERPHGEWIEHRTHTGYFVSEYECSNCHDDVWQKTEWQFCPNCGADMRVKTDFN